MNGAFTTCIKDIHESVYQDAPLFHLVPYAKGGIQRLINMIKKKTVPDLPEYGYHTNSNGHFDPKENCVMGLRFKVEKILDNKGQSAVIVLAQDEFASRKVVIKVLHSQHYQLGVQESHVLRKLAYADPLNHSHTLRLLTTLTFDSHYCLVFEPLLPDPLTVVFRNIPSNRVLSAVRQVGLRLLATVGFLHQQNLIHTDLKPDNILLKQENDLDSVHVVDFGNTISYVHSEMYIYYKDFELQTPVYRAPEVLFGMPFGPKIDMWSLGCILAELVLGKPLVFGSSKEDIVQQMTDLLGPYPANIFRRGKYFKLYQKYTSDTNQENCTLKIMEHIQCKDITFTDLLAGLLRYNPDERLTASEAARHPFFASYLPLTFLMPDNNGSSSYSTVSLTKEAYSFSPHIPTHIKRQQLSRVQLLRHGTIELLNQDQPTIIRPSPRHGRIRGNNSDMSVEDDQRQSTSGSLDNSSNTKIPSEISIVRNFIAAKDNDEISQNVKSKMTSLLKAIRQEQDLVEEDLERRDVDSARRQHNLSATINAGHTWHRDVTLSRPCPKYGRFNIHRSESGNHQASINGGTQPRESVAVIKETELSNFEKSLNNSVGSHANTVTVNERHFDKSSSKNLSSISNDDSRSTSILKEKNLSRSPKTPKHFIRNDTNKNYIKKCGATDAFFDRKSFNESARTNTSYGSVSDNDVTEKTDTSKLRNHSDYHKSGKVITGEENGLLQDNNFSGIRVANSLPATAKTDMPTKRNLEQINKGRDQYHIDKAPTGLQTKKNHTEIMASFESPSRKRPPSEDEYVDLLSPPTAVSSQKKTKWDINSPRVNCPAGSPGRKHQIDMKTESTKMLPIKLSDEEKEDCKTFSQQQLLPRNSLNTSNKNIKRTLNEIKNSPRSGVRNSDLTLSSRPAKQGQLQFKSSPDEMPGFTPIKREESFTGCSRVTLESPEIFYKNINADNRKQKLEADNRTKQYLGRQQNNEHVLSERLRGLSESEKYAELSTNKPSSGKQREYYNPFPTRRAIHSKSDHKLKPSEEKTVEFSRRTSLDSSKKMGGTSSEMSGAVYAFKETPDTDLKSLASKGGYAGRIAKVGQKRKRARKSLIFNSVQSDTESTRSIQDLEVRDNGERFRREQLDIGPSDERDLDSEESGEDYSGEEIIDYCEVEASTTQNRGRINTAQLDKLRDLKKKSEAQKHNFKTTVNSGGQSSRLVPSHKQSQQVYRTTDQKPISNVVVKRKHNMPRTDTLTMGHKVKNFNNTYIIDFESPRT